MQHPVNRRSGLSAPPMYAWPRPLKLAVLALAALLCLVAYGGLAAAIIALFSLFMTLQ